MTGDAVFQSGKGPAVRAVKAGSALIGIDDGPFSFGQKRCALVGVKTRLDGSVLGIASSEIAVDGSDAEREIVRVVEELADPSVRIVLLDGITFGGMNLARPSKVWLATGIPVAALVRGEPDMSSMRRVVGSKLSADPRKLEALESPAPVPLGTGDLHANLAGIEEDMARHLVRAGTLNGFEPECLRLAHMIAKAVGKKLKVSASPMRGRSAAGRQARRRPRAGRPGRTSP